MAEQKDNITYTTKPPKKDIVKKEPTPGKPGKFDIAVDKPEFNKIVPDNYPEVPKLQVFDVKDEKNKLPEGFFLICEGARRSGKSEFLKWLLYHYKDDFQLALVCTETPQNGFWQPMIGNKWVHNGWDPFMVEKLLDEQRKEKDREKHERNYKSRKVLLILDDIIGDRRHIHEDAVLNKLAVQGRHFNISICLTTQEPHAIGTALRNNCDMVVIFQQKSQRAKKSVCDDFLGFKMDFEWQSKDLLKTYTENHNCIIIKMWDLNKGPKQAYRFLPETITWDKAKEKSRVPEYQLGCREQKALAQTREGKLPLF